MMSMMFYILVWGMGMIWLNYGFWLNVGFVSLFFLLSVFFSPLTSGVNILGYETMFDTLSFSLWVLSVWLIILMTTSSYSIWKEDNASEYFIFLLSMMLLMLMMTFGSSNYLVFYIFFEASLIPTLLVIMGWGYQTERLQAGVYFLFYTLTSSLPLLLAILWAYSKFGSVTMTGSALNLVSGTEANWWDYLLVMSLSSAFLVKMPMFFVHLWLPSAHVEAPVAGSMILAGVLLKLGGYGLCRVLSGFPSVLLGLSNLMISLGLVSMLVVGTMCCRLNDMSALVAYSSVAHMGLVIAGLFVGGVMGFSGSLIMMIGHGLASSGLFSILNMYYERTGSRSFYLNKGMILVLPTLSLSMFLLCAANMGAPPTINLLSELYLLGSLMGFHSMVVYLFPLGSFMGVVFTIFLFSYSQHGSLGFMVLGGWNLQLVEFSSLMLHVIPLNLLVVKFDLFLLWL